MALGLGELHWEEVPCRRGRVPAEVGSSACTLRCGAWAVGVPTGGGPAATLRKQCAWWPGGAALVFLGGQCRDS